MILVVVAVAFWSPVDEVPKAKQAVANPKLISVRKIWDEAPHNAFTDLIYFKDRWYCVFREGAKHVSSDGKLRVIVSDDTVNWKSAALLSSKDSDLRDAKISLAPTGELMLLGAGAFHDRLKRSHQSYAWFSSNGVDWSDAVEVGDPDFWLWRVNWKNSLGLGIGYGVRKTNQFVRLYRTTNGREFEVVVPTLFEAGYPNESSMVFTEDGKCLCLLRRDGNPNNGMLGVASPPYKDWMWKDLNVRIGGPHMIQLPDGRLIAAVRLYDGKVRTSLCWLDADKLMLSECLPLPSGGDTSYAGLVYRNKKLYVSYYSSHEKKTSIYLAEVQVD